MPFIVRWGPFLREVRSALIWAGFFAAVLFLMMLKGEG